LKTIPRTAGKDAEMRVHKIDRSDRFDTAFAGTDSIAPEPRLASTHLLGSSARTGRDQSNIWSRRIPPKLWSKVAERLTYIDGLPILVRLLIEDKPSEMQSGLSPQGNDIYSLLSGTLEKMVDRAHACSLQADARSRHPVPKVDVPSNGESLAGPTTPANAIVLRVGQLELDLLDRTAKRGERKIDLRPREFQLLKYMMQRSEQLLTRATLLKEVWRYRFVPETNLVDVHMGRLRRKIDAPNESPLICNVRGLGFILNETSCSLSSPSKPDQLVGTRKIRVPGAGFSAT
jgi:DNA-binding winged helix-turn-helix (wHTH) protein